MRTWRIIIIVSPLAGLDVGISWRPPTYSLLIVLTTERIMHNEKTRRMQQTRKIKNVNTLYNIRTMKLLRVWKGREFKVLNRILLAYQLTDRLIDKQFSRHVVQIQCVLGLFLDTFADLYIYIVFARCSTLLARHKRQWLRLYAVVKVVLWSRGGSPDEARLEQTPYPFQPH